MIYDLKSERRRRELAKQMRTRYDEAVIGGGQKETVAPGGARWQLDDTMYGVRFEKFPRSREFGE